MMMAMNNTISVLSLVLLVGCMVHAKSFDRVTRTLEDCNNLWKIVGGTGNIEGKSMPDDGVDDQAACTDRFVPSNRYPAQSEHQGDERQLDSAPLPGLLAC